MSSRLFEKPTADQLLERRLLAVRLERRRVPVRFIGSIVLTLLVWVCLSVTCAPTSEAQGPSPLVGTFRITAGSCNPATGAVSGSYFRLIFPHGNVRHGFFFENSTSPCYDKSYTTISPGTQGGLVTGVFQVGPRRAFDAKGDAQATAIIRPVPFASVALSLSTQSRDPQSRKVVSPPSIQNAGGILSGNLEALSVSWKRIYINQGSPKPGGAHPGLTLPVSGTFNKRTHRFTLLWTSQIVAGPFVGFIGEWYLTGTFVGSR
jgi:hypothetical protein